MRCSAHSTWRGPTTPASAPGSTSRSSGSRCSPSPESRCRCCGSVTAQARLARMNESVVAQIRAALERALSPSSLEIVDDSARHAGHTSARGGGHFKVTLVAGAFRGRAPLERHRLVYAAVAPLMRDAVHALNIVARSPEEASDRG